MSYYVHGGKMSYEDYLTAKSFAKDFTSTTNKAGERVAMEVSRQSREIIASNEALARENIEAMDAMSSTLDSGFENLSYGLGEIRDGIYELNSKFHWGFSQMLSGIDRMNDSLSTLIKIAKTPAQSAAYEHFEIARDAFKRCLYIESMESLNKAINGDQASSGYRLEWRFHQLKGTVQIGFAGCDTSLVNPADAEQSFLDTARYAGTEFPEQAAKAFLSAGWASYCQGNMKEALSHTEQALEINPKLGEALFQAAKVRMALGEFDSALPMLAKAIDVDPFYTLKAAGDGNFQEYDIEFRIFLEALRNEKYLQTIPKVEAALVRIQLWLKLDGNAKNNATVMKWNAFIEKGNTWPIIDTLILSRELNDEISKLLHQSISVFEIFRELITETYEKEVIIKPGSLFRFEVKEYQTTVRSIMIRDEIICGNGTKLNIEFCNISSGIFLMGTDNTPEAKQRVKISKDYYICKFLISQSQWNLVMGLISNQENMQVPISVSWENSQIFIERLNNAAGKLRYRLPTEAEWEFACRTGQKSYYQGEGNPNSWGLHGMYNKDVKEWCNDWYTNNLFMYYNEATSIDPSGPIESINMHGNRQVINFGRVCRSGGTRSHGNPQTSTFCFRLVTTEN